MRIIKAILKSLIVLGIIGLIVGLIGREVLLFFALRQVKSSLKHITNIDRDQVYAAQCMSKGSTQDVTGKVHHSQLRFIDDSQYVTEVICNGFDFSPIEIDQVKLMPLVERQSGHSGLMLGLDTAVNVECVGRTAAVRFKDTFLDTEYQSVKIEKGAGPKTECEAFGYQCCDHKYQAGVNGQVTNVNDCPDSCFYECQDRPLVLNFTTIPYSQSLSRSLTIKNNQEVTFNYLVSPTQDDSFAGAVIETEFDNPIEEYLYKISSFFDQQNGDQNQVEVILDFGDGQQEKLMTLQDSTAHTYSCTTNKCEFTASLSVKNAQDIKSYQDVHSQVKINVTP